MSMAPVPAAGSQCAHARCREGSNASFIQQPVASGEGGEYAAAKVQQRAATVFHRSMPPKTPTRGHAGNRLAAHVQQQINMIMQAS